MKRKIAVIVGLLMMGLSPVLAVPVGNNIELIPVPRNLGINTVNTSQKLTVNGAVAIMSFASAPVVISSQPTIYVQNNQLLYKSPLHTTAFRLDVADSTNGTILNPTIINPTLSGLVKFAPGTKVQPFTVNGTINALLFNGGTFKGDGSLITNLQATNITGIVTANKIDPNFRPSALKAPDGSPDPAVTVSNNGDLSVLTGGISFGNSARGFNITQSYLALGETISGASTILGNNVKAHNTLNNTLIKHASGTDAANWIKVNYSTGVTFHTGATGALNANITDATNERLRIDTTGNVGIGTSAPSAKLDVIGDIVSSRLFPGAGTATNPGLTTINDTAADTGIFWPGTPNQNSLAITTAGTEKLRVMSDGNVGIGYLAPQHKLHVAGNVGAFNFIGNGTGLKNIPATSIDPNFRPSALKAPDGSPDPALQVDNAGKIGIGTISPISDLDVRTPGNSGYVQVRADDGGIDLGSGNDLQSYVDFKSNNTLGKDFQGRLLYLDGTGFSFHTKANLTPKLMLTDLGNLGIGTATPISELDIRSSTNTGYVQARANDGGLELGSGNDAQSYVDFKGSNTLGKDFQGRLLYLDGIGMSFHTQGSLISKMTLNDIGNLGIGIASATEKLQVIGNAKAFNFIGNGTGLKNIPLSAINTIGTQLQPITVNGAINADFFNGGIFKGDGAQLTNVVPSKLKAPDGSPNPALQVNNGGNIGIGTTTPLSLLHTTGTLTVGPVPVGNPSSVQLTTGGASPINNRLAFGTDGTGWKFAIAKNQTGAVTDLLTVTDAGNVGIGTTSPQQSNLHVVSSNFSRVTAQHTNEAMWSEFATAGIDSSSQFVKKWSVGSTGDTRPAATGGPNKFYIFQYTDQNDVSVNGYRMVIDSTGNTGFGTMSPSQKLEVAGTVKAFNFIGNGTGLKNIPLNAINTIGTKIQPITVNGAINATLFNGGVFKGDGAQLTNIVPSSLKAPDGSPNPAFQINNNGNAILPETLHADGNHFNVLSYSSNTTPTNGIKIKTNIPFVVSAGMPTLIFEGYNYGQRKTIGITLNWYVYNSGANNPIASPYIAASSHGGYTPEIKIARENGKVVLFINDNQYFNRFSIRAYAKNLSEQDSWFEGWTTADEALTGDQVATFVYKNSFGEIFANNITGNGTGLKNIPLNAINTIGTKIQPITVNGTINATLFNGGVFKGDGSLLTNIVPSSLKAPDGSPNPALQVDNAGKIGIGTISPISDLDVRTPGNSGYVQLRADDGGIDVASGNDGMSYIDFKGNNSLTKDFQGRILYIDGSGLSFYTQGNTTSKMIIDGAGNVGIGTNTPTSRLDVIGGLKAYFLGLRDGIPLDILNMINFFNNNPNTLDAYLFSYGKSLFYIRRGASGNEITPITHNSLFGVGSSNNFEIGDYIPDLHVHTNHNVGIGIGRNAPAANLQVAGSLLSATFYQTNQVTVPGVSPTTTVNWNSANRQILTLNTSVATVDFTDPPATQVGSIVLEIKQDGTGGRTVTTWDTKTRWPGGYCPPLSTTPNAVDVISCIWDGSLYMCQLSKDFKPQGTP